MSCNWEQFRAGEPHLSVVGTGGGREVGGGGAWREVSGGGSRNLQVDAVVMVLFWVSPIHQ